MLCITRRSGESFFVEPFSDIPQDLAVAELFADGPIEVAFLSRDGKQTKIGINAPSFLNVVRSELII